MQNLNPRTSGVRDTMGMLPSTVAAEIPSLFKRHSMSSRNRLNCEKTSA